MTRLKIVGSSSSGNAYILDCGSEQLILELGVSWKEILKALNFDLSKVRACLVTHSHQDHSAGRCFHDRLCAGCHGGGE